MELKELAPLVEALQPGDNVFITAYDTVKIRKYEDEEMTEINSPFSSNKQYEDFIRSYFGKLNRYGVVSKIDEAHDIKIVCIGHKFSIGEYAIFIRKLRKPTDIKSPCISLQS